MIMPLYDDNTGRRIVPFVTYALIAANVFVFVVLQGMGTNDDFTYAYSTVPQEIYTGKDLDDNLVLIDEHTGRPVIDRATHRPVVIPHRATPISVYLTLLTSMFLHGGIAHLLGNMLFLWIFGDNVEDALGHLGYIAFYLICGLLASLAHVATVIVFNGPDSQSAMIPSLGASGAISGVLGGYLILYPHRQVLVLLFRFVTWVPAYVAIGMWFVFQLINSLGIFGGMSDGVAYAAHIGGFGAGVILIKTFEKFGPGVRQGVPWDEEREENERRGRDMGDDGRYR
jgi:membrane associated rhomboid family serine protease